MMLKPGIYRQIRHEVELYVDEYGVKQWKLVATVQGETHEIELGVEETEESAYIKAARKWSLQVISQKLPSNRMRQLVEAVEADLGPHVWLRYCDPKTNVFQTYLLSEHVNEWLETGVWPEAD